jgi:nitrite reductase/ring-hydroxylating ferredoxin subunit
MDTVTLADSSCGQVLCRLDDIPDGGAIAVDALLADGESSVVLLRHGTQVRAYLNVCPHAGRRLDYAPGKFLLKQGTLICAVHGATFNQDDGVCIAGPCRGDGLRVVPVQIEEGDVRIP